MTTFMQRHLALIVVTSVVALGVTTLMPVSALAVTTTTASTHQPRTVCCPGGEPFWGANQSWTRTATSQWPQKEGNWCGIANIEAIEVYDWIKYDGNSNPQYASQSSIANLLNSSSAVSPWGRAIANPGDPGPAFAADIAPDGGTDPRAIAWGIWDVTPPGYYFHNWIYSNTVGAYGATQYFASDFGPAHGMNDPISVTINGGAHSFVVDGVWSYNDPSLGPGTTSIDGVDTFDPWVNSGFKPINVYNSTTEEVWSTSDWTGLTKLWGQGYNTGNGFDPEPRTNPTYYRPPFASSPHHWDLDFVTIEQDNVTRCQASPNIAYDQNGNEVAHNGVTYCP